jgi:hypothetical protein
MCQGGAGQTPPHGNVFRFLVFLGPRNSANGLAGALRPHGFGIQLRLGFDVQGLDRLGQVG